MKYALLIGFCLWTSTWAQAQVPSVGFEGGLTISTLSGPGTPLLFSLPESVRNQLQSRAPRPDFFVGVYTSMPFAGPTTLRLTLQVARQGTRFRDPIRSGLGNWYAHLLLPVEWAPRAGYRLMAGPQLGWLMQARLRSNNFDYDVTSDFRRFAIGFMVGGAYVLSPELALTLRHSIGLNNQMAFDRYFTHQVTFLGIDYYLK